jgi:hypothetical protein
MTFRVGSGFLHFFREFFETFHQSKMNFIICSKGLEHSYSVKDYELLIKMNVYLSEYKRVFSKFIVKLEIVEIEEVKSVL